MRGSWRSCAEWGRILSACMRRLVEKSNEVLLDCPAYSGDQPSYESLLDRRRLLSSRNLAETERLGLARRRCCSGPALGSGCNRLRTHRSRETRIGPLRGSEMLQRIHD